MRVDERGETAQDWLVAGDDRDGEDRSAILQRRAIFVASAIVGLAAPACGDPQPCLNISQPEPPSATASAQEPPDAGAPEAADAGDADAPPGPCLKVAPPQPCLEMVPVPTSSSSAPPLPPPRPCLNKRPPPPQPCLDMPPPVPPPKDPSKP